jgi:hypothetical protein
MGLLKIGAGRLYFSYWNKWNYIYACTLELYDILKVKNALGKVCVLHHRHHLQSWYLECPWLLRLSTLLCMVSFFDWYLNVVCSPSFPVHTVSDKIYKSACNMWCSHRGSRGISVFIHNLNTRWGWLVSAMPQLLYLQERAPVSIVQEARLAPGLVWKGVKEGKFLVPTGVRTSN